VTPTAPATVPGAPTIGIATTGNAQATVTFTAPASDGGSAITSYTATSSPGAFSGNCTAPCNSINVGGLTNGVAYAVHGEGDQRDRHQFALGSFQ
jgi:hypothetical protein